MDKNDRSSLSPQVTPNPEEPSRASPYLLRCYQNDLVAGFLSGMLTFLLIGYLFPIFAMNFWGLDAVLLSIIIFSVFCIQVMVLWRVGRRWPTFTKSAIAGAAFVLVYVISCWWTA